MASDDFKVTGNSFQILDVMRSLVCDKLNAKIL